MHPIMFQELHKCITYLPWWTERCPNTFLHFVDVASHLHFIMMIIVSCIIMFIISHTAEEILHHLGCIESCKQCDKLPTSTGYQLLSWISETSTVSNIIPHSDPHPYPYILKRWQLESSTNEPLPRLRNLKTEQRP